MATTINLEYFGMPGSGATVKEAKVDAGTKLERFVTEDATPVLLAHRGYLLCISRSRWGWGYRFWQFAEMKPRTDADLCSCGFASRDSAVLAAVRHLADVTRNPGERDSELFSALRNDRERSHEIAAFADKAAKDDVFQARYREARSRGLSDIDCHNYALCNPATPELWQPSR